MRSWYIPVLSMMTTGSSNCSLKTRNGHKISKFCWPWSSLVQDSQDFVSSSLARSKFSKFVRSALSFPNFLVLVRFWTNRFCSVYPWPLDCPESCPRPIKANKGPPSQYDPSRPIYPWLKSLFRRYRIIRRFHLCVRPSRTYKTRIKVWYYLGWSPCRNWN